MFFVYFEMIKLAGGGARAATASVSEATRAKDKRIPTSNSNDADVAIPTEQRVGPIEASGL